MGFFQSIFFLNPNFITSLGYVFVCGEILHLCYSPECSLSEKWNLAQFSNYYSYK